MTDRGTIKTFEVKVELRIGAKAIDGIRRAFEYSCTDAADLLPGVELAAVSVERLSADMIEIKRTYRVRISGPESEQIANNLTRGGCRVVAEEEI